MADRFESVEEAVHYMLNTYDRSGKYLVDGVPKYTAHAVKMEEEYGLVGIAGRYQFIDGKAAPFAEYGYRKEYQKYFIADSFLRSDDPYRKQAGAVLEKEIPAALERVNREIAQLTAMNPELKRLNYNRREINEAYRALIGITSQYNPDDINAYLHAARTGTRSREISERVEKIHKERGINFGWQPAMKTLEKIEKQLRAKDKTRHTAARLAFSRSASR